MKLIQVNGWLGRLNGPLARFISEEAPDIVCLQEALRPTSDDLLAFADQYDYIAELKDAGKFSNLFFSPAWGFKLGDTTINVGNAILSKHELTNRKETPTNNPYFIAQSRNDYQSNTRLLQSATVKLNYGQEFSIANHQGHLSGKHAMGDQVSVEKMNKVAELLSELPRPLIFCGDLNVGPATPTMAALDSLGLRNLTVETNVASTLSTAHRAPVDDRRKVACDYILVSDKISVKDFKVVDEVVSDHKALILEFEV